MGRRIRPPGWSPRTWANSQRSRLLAQRMSALSHDAMSRKASLLPTCAAAARMRLFRLAQGEASRPTFQPAFSEQASADWFILPFARRALPTGSNAADEKHRQAPRAGGSTALDAAHKAAPACNVGFGSCVDGSPLARTFWKLPRGWSVRSCVRPVDAARLGRWP